MLAVHAAARRAVDRARGGGGPTLVEAMTYRMKGHAEHDAQSYVPKEELDEWREKDPIARYTKVLVASGTASPNELAGIDQAIGEEVDREVERAEASPLPAPEFAMEGVYARGPAPVEPAPARRRS